MPCYCFIDEHLKFRQVNCNNRDNFVLIIGNLTSDHPVVWGCVSNYCIFIDQYKPWWSVCAQNLCHMYYSVING